MTGHHNMLMTAGYGQFGDLGLNWAPARAGRADRERFGRDPGALAGPLRRVCGRFTDSRRASIRPAKTLQLRR